MKGSGSDLRVYSTLWITDAVVERSWIAQDEESPSQAKVNYIPAISAFNGDRFMVQMMDGTGARMPDSPLPRSEDPLSSEIGTYPKVKAGFFHGLSGESPSNLWSWSLFALKRCYSPDCRVKRMTKVHQT